MQRGATYLVTIRTGPELWHLGRNLDSAEAGVMGEPRAWVSPRDSDQSAHPQAEFPKATSRVYILRGNF